ncbi:DUF4226 domain-containing protein [Mycolicibacterium houstonense]|uniref:DUF4226 domain-containing protein n=1 Tax=Mycolicibacterium houstonense TaxID=146021 RepID=UPI003F9A145F
MASYDDLRNVLEHIKDETGDENAWKQGLTPQQIRDVNGWLASDGAGSKGFKDPETGVIYDDRSHYNSAQNPAVPDADLDRIRNVHSSLFDPSTRAPVTPANPAPSPAGAPGAPANPVGSTDPKLDDPTGVPNPHPMPAGEGIATEEESSGRASEAIKKVKKELDDRQSNVREADAKLAEVMLSANAADEAGRAGLQKIQKDIVAALNDPKYNLDTQDGELQFLKFLKEKAEDAQKLVDDGKVAAADGQKMALALADFYKQGSRGGNSGDPQTPANPGETPGAPPAGDPGAYPTDPGLLGPAPGMPDPTLSDLSMPPDIGPGLSDAIQGVAPLLSGMGNPLGGGLGGGGLDLGAVTKPIGDAISAATDHAKPNEPAPEDKGDEKSDKDNPDEKDKDKPGEKPEPEPKDPPKPDQPAPPATPGAVPDPALAPGAPVAPSLGIDLKDGSHITAADPSRKGATDAMLEGTAYGEALRLNGLSAPPPGTTLTNYLAPNQLQPADFAMYRDKLVGVLGPDKWVGAGGDPQPMNTLPQDGFLGYGRPTAAGGTVAAPAAPEAPPPPAAPAAHQQVPPPTPPQAPK